ncbi:MAG: flavin reductase family protein [Bacteroidota bacterium]|nr:flavin reductase family protein [Bacteroidota bacterium]
MSGRDEELRGVMRQVPSSVAIVTAVGAQEARGITVGSFNSVSLRPPLISFNVSNDCRMHPLLMHAERFNVNVLTDQQLDVSRTFAEPDQDGADQLAAVRYCLDRWGIPVLADTVALLSCSTWARHAAGDHVLVIGRVQSAKIEGDRMPLVYLDRSYHRMGRRIGSQTWPI